MKKATLLVHLASLSTSTKNNHVQRSSRRSLFVCLGRRRTAMSSDDAEIVRLNVGGSLYTTCRKTLLKDPNSMFPQLLAGGDEAARHEAYSAILADGTLFIDRDGPLFTYVLDYLRSGRLVLSDNFRETARLREEIVFYQLNGMLRLIAPYYNVRYPNKALLTNGTTSAITPTNPVTESGGYITLGYRGTFAFGRDGQADVKFRKLHRILVCGKAALCREVFGDTLNESRDPDREGIERYTSRLYLKHQCLEKACDTLTEKGFKLVATCSSGANGLATPGHSLITSQSGCNQQELMNQRNSGDYEEQRWAHYTEYVFYREPQVNSTLATLGNHALSPITSSSFSI
ncbi:hypothetical protein QR680_000670 [Steinernema hermaphroditum]|uniref:BTB domain-containing protein n=1 Tax=Steinernema hermaphroditum TaxID=289476 RepID=A0AA39LEH6_9BILA|nr:hypothetical protein QR680_000670 [Steinernema hermaphroditum]